MLFFMGPLANLGVKCVLKFIIKCIYNLPKEIIEYSLKNEDDYSLQIV